MQIQDQVAEIRNTYHSSMQLDVFNNENGQILMQIFQHSSFKKWEGESSFSSGEGLVLSLNLHKSKANNSKNKERFFQSSFFSSFVKGQQVADEYFLFISYEKTDFQIANELTEILFEVYGNEINSRFELNVY